MLQIIEICVIFCTFCLCVLVYDFDKMANCAIFLNENHLDRWSKKQSRNKNEIEIRYSCLRCRLCFCCTRHG